LTQSLLYDYYIWRRINVAAQSQGTGPGEITVISGKKRKPLTYPHSRIMDA